MALSCAHRAFPLSGGTADLCRDPRGHGDCVVLLDVQLLDTKRHSHVGYLCHRASNGGFEKYGGERREWSREGRGGRVVLPLSELEMLNIKGQAAVGILAAPEYLMLASLYGLIYAGALLSGACLVFQRRDF